MFCSDFDRPGYRTQHSDKSWQPHKCCHAHPCVEWLKASRENLIWAVDHVDELCYEHERRFNGKIPFSRVQLNGFIFNHYHELIDHTTERASDPIRPGNARRVPRPQCSRGIPQLLHRRESQLRRMEPL